MKSSGDAKAGVLALVSAAFIAGALVGAIEVWTMADDGDAAAASARIARLMPRWWPDAG